jgi:hypothetical protein
MSTRALTALDAPASTATRRVQLATVVPLLLTLAAVAVWASGLGSIDLRKMNDLGLISVLPVRMLVAMGLLAISFALSLQMRAVRDVVLFVHTLALILMIYALPILVEDVPRLAAAWRHSGVIEYIGRVGDIDPTIDAYFNWPGFFIADAFLVDVAGLESALTVARWAPVFFNLIFLAPLLVIFRTATTDKRLVWGGVWFFYLTNWVSQDYFSPQAFGFFLYLVVIAALLRWFSQTEADAELTTPALWRWTSATPPAHEIETAESPGRRTGILAALMLLVAAIVPSHQLTPFAALAGFTTLVGFNRCQIRRLPLLTAVLIGTWMTFMAAAYLAGHLGDLLSQVGELGTTVDANVRARVGGSPEHLLVVYARLGVTGALWLFAAVGGYRAYQEGRQWLPFALLAVAPFPLMALQPYGGEMLLRVYMFSLPFVAFFCASLFVSSSGAGRWTRTAALGCVSVVLLTALLVNRYGNERMEYFTTGEVRAVEHLYEIAEPGSLVIVGTRNFPQSFRSYEQLDYELVAERPDWTRLELDDPDTAELARALARTMRASPTREAYVLITRSQKAEVDLMGLGPRGSLDRLERDLIASPRFEVLFANVDAKLFTLAANAKGDVR